MFFFLFFFQTSKRAPKQPPAISGWLWIATFLLFMKREQNKVYSEANSKFNRIPIFFSSLHSLVLLLSVSSVKAISRIWQTRLPTFSIEKSIGSEVDTLLCLRRNMCFEKIYAYWMCSPCLPFSRSHSCRSFIVRCETAKIRHDALCIYRDGVHTYGYRVR